MPEINNKNVVEQSRTEVHNEDNLHIAKLSNDLARHCQQNEDRDKVLDERDAKTEKKLDKLMPLVDLVPLLNQMVEEKRAYTLIASKIIKWIGILGALLGLLWGIIQLWKEYKR